MFKPRLTGRVSTSIDTPFPCPSPLALARLNDLIALAKITFDRGWNPGTAGNFSIRQDRHLMWQSPSGLMKGRLRVEQFLAVNIASAEALSPEAPKPSAETPLHAAIYREDLAAMAVFHVHSPWVLRRARRGLRFSGQEMQKALGLTTHEGEVEIPVVANSQDLHALAENLAGQLNCKLRLLVLEDHGVYAWGQEPEEAFHRLEALEFLCQTQ